MWYQICTVKKEIVSCAAEVLVSDLGGGGLLERGSNNPPPNLCFFACVNFEKVPMKIFKKVSVNILLLPVND